MDFALRMMPHPVVELVVGHNVGKSVVNVPEVLEQGVAALVFVHENGIAMAHSCAVRIVSPPRSHTS